MQNLHAWLLLRCSTREREDERETNLCHTALPSRCYPSHPPANSSGVKTRMSSSTPGQGLSCQDRACPMLARLTAGLPANTQAMVFKSGHLLSITPTGRQSAKETFLTQWMWASAPKVEALSSETLETPWGQWQ